MTAVEIIQAKIDFIQKRVDRTDFINNIKSIENDEFAIDVLREILTEIKNPNNQHEQD